EPDDEVVEDDSEIGLNGLKVKKGHGLQSYNHEINGKYYIDKRALDRGLLELRYKKNGHLTAFKAITMSPDEKVVLTDLIMRGTYNHSDYIKLTAQGKHLVNRLAGFLGKEVNNDDIDKFQREWDITRGEIAAGNNNTVLKAKMRKMILYAIDVGKITRHQAHKLMIDMEL
ncbi:MAG: hypothetical protein K2P99_00060, partial [Burkholderiales bacterium]|nr:hypothetical protein [Burkholderiales bacterium]